MSQTRRLAAIFRSRYGGVFAAMGASETAFSHRSAMGYLSSWIDPAEDDVNIRWTCELSEALHLGQGRVNQIGLETDEGSERIKAAYGANYERLVGLKNKYDPTNLFRHNQNIKPTV
jgi:hypothetical protein